MNIERKMIRQASLEKLVLKLMEDGDQIFAPVKKNDVVNFSRISTFQEMTIDYITTTLSAKSMVFPRVECLFEMQTSRENIILKGKDLSLIPEVVLIGTRPCDAVGFNSLNAIFMWDCKDNIFATRFKRTTIISISCNKCDAKCFCTSVNVSPGGTAGTDILLTRIGNEGFLAEMVTEKGHALTAKYQDLFEPAGGVDKSRYIVEVPLAFDLKTILDNIGDHFDSQSWFEQSLRCIGCGACAYVCPVCACFDIQDVHDGTHGHRKRSWDSCGFSLFTLHSSGYNPREKQSSRWRQRVMHKFSYMPLRLGVFGCVGCGRCSRACPVDMNLKEHLADLANKLKK